MTLKVFDPSRPAGRQVLPSLPRAVKPARPFISELAELYCEGREAPAEVADFVFWAEQFVSEHWPVSLQSTRRRGGDVVILLKLRNHDPWLAIGAGSSAPDGRRGA
jgi:hypothetical protein